ncbi:hypothetical protein XELAEV_18002443mg [Xenopus laevis]|uniref:Uncharacterized protein n=1 Tax=Xenopus laevis TaxID=8355 RepID=A0A974GZ27_XENLA|nr:hypothetical protein XELAEV_18002443mg [Xenopus laevis]
MLIWSGQERAFGYKISWKKDLSAKAVESAALALESVHHIHGGNGLPLGVLSVGDGIPDYILQENLENPTSLLIDETRDALDSPSPCQAADGGLGDALDVVPEHLSMPLGASFPKSLSSFAASRHFMSVLESQFIYSSSSTSLYAAGEDLRENSKIMGGVYQRRVIHAMSS